MIRLGSLGGYPFEGPRVLAGWTAPSRPAVFAILMRPDPDRDPEQYAVIDVGASEDLSQERFPFKHPRSKCWVQRAGSRFGVYICFYEVPGGLPTHREQIRQELAAIYKPGCSPDQFDQQWRDEWIGSYEAPTTGPLTTQRDLSGADENRTD